MPVRQLVIAAAFAALAGTAAAEPATDPAPQAPKRPQAGQPIVVAAAQPAPLRVAASPEQESAPVKRVRTARISNCRCGGQTPAEN